MNFSTSITVIFFSLCIASSFAYAPATILKTITRASLSKNRKTTLTEVVESLYWAIHVLVLVSCQHFNYHHKIKSIQNKPKRTPSISTIFFGLCCVLAAVTSTDAFSPVTVSTTIASAARISNNNKGTQLNLYQRRRNA
jgi:hypothetical protein